MPTAFSLDLAPGHIVRLFTQVHAPPPIALRPRLRVLLLTWITVLAAAVPAAAQLCPATANPCVVTGNPKITDPAGATIDLGTRALIIKRGGSITVAPGNLTLIAGNVTLEPNGRILATGNGDVGGRLTIRSSGTVRAQADADGSSPSQLNASATFQGGEVNVQATSDIVVDGLLDVKSENTSGGGGVLNLTSTASNVTLGAFSRVPARGGAQGGGGTILLTATVGTLTVHTPLDVSGGDGGEIELYAGGDITLTGPATIDLHGTLSDGGYGGTFTVVSAGNISIGSRLDGRASGNFNGTGTGAEVDIYTSRGSITLGGVMDLSGPAPDGEGGAATIEAALDVTQSGTLIAAGHGASGCGGSIDVSAGRTLTMGETDASGGNCGAGDFSATSRGAITQRAGTTVNIDSDGGAAGSISLDGATISGPLNLHADGLNGGMCGLVLAHACTLTVPVGARLSASGGGRAIVTQGTRLDVNVAMTLAGTVLGCPPRPESNLLRYADAASPPDIQPTAQINPVATQVLMPNLTPCQSTPPPTTTSTTTTSTSSTSTTTSSTTSSTSTTVTAPPTTSTTTSTTASTSTSTSTSSTSTTTAVVTSTTSSTTATTTSTTSSTSTTTTVVTSTTSSTTATTTSTTSSTTAITTSTTSSTIATTTTSSTSSTTATTSSSTTTETTTTSITTTTGSTSSTTTTTTRSSTTSTSTSTTVAPTTSSTTATIPSTTTTTSPPVSVPTTTLPPTGCVVGASLACDDAQTCDPSIAFDAVGCRLGLLDTSIVQASADDFSGAGLQKKVRNKVTAARRFLDKGRAATGKRSEKAIKKASRQLNTLVRLVQKGKDRGKVNLRVGDPLLALAQRTIAQLARLQTAVLP